MENLFFDDPILNSPYDYPSRHWELDETGQPTQQVIETRLGAEFITPIPKPRHRGGPAAGVNSNWCSTKGRACLRPSNSIRLRVLQPNDPDTDYASRELVPNDMLGDLQRARIVITNYHGLRPRAFVDLQRQQRPSTGAGWAH